MNAMNSNSIPKWLAVVVVLQVMLLLSQWGAGPSARIAQAQIPDAGEQRVQMIDAQKATNDKLDKLLDLLKSGDLQVKVVKPDDAKGHE
jgi:hypothetical protein